MSASRAKRPFAGAAADPAQRQITSFFTSSSAAEATTAAAHPSATESYRPRLPAETQSNLLNVGMRVRKSVPEGYKTGTYSAFSLFDETHDPRNKASRSNTTVAATTAPARVPSSQRELLPFCGINKIGGLSFSSSQESQTQPLFTFTTVPALDDVPSLSSSQDSVASVASTSTTAQLSINTATHDLNRKKRLHADDGYGNSDEDDSDTPSVSSCLQVPSGEWMDGQVSPRSLVPTGSQWENTRVMAVPRKARRSLGLGGGAATVPTVMITGVSDDKRGGVARSQENMVVDEDFPEADFLDYQVLQGDAMDM